MSGKNDIVAGIRLEGEKEFRDGLTSINKSLTATKSELDKVTAEYDGQANSLEALTAKQKVLNKILDEQKNKVTASKAGLDHARESYENVGKGLDELYVSLEKAQDKLKDINAIYGESSTEAKKQRKEVDELSAAVSKGEQNYKKAGDRCKTWETKLNTAEAQVIRASKAVNENAAYMREAENATDGCAKSIDKFGKKIATVNTDTFLDTVKANLYSNAYTRAFDTIVDGAKKAAKYTVEVGSSFEAAMSEVAAISGATGDQLSRMEEKAKELGSSTKFSATEAAEALKYMSLAGWSTEDMLAGIDGIMQLAAASGMDLAKASDMVTDYLSAFGLQASDSAKMADMLAFAQANSNTTAEQLGEAYQNSAANLNAAGQDIETTTSLLEAMANQGYKGSEAGTALSAIMRDITKSMKDGEIAIGDTAVQVMDSEGNYRDLTDILKDVEDATDDMGDAERAAALASTFTSDSTKGLNLILNEGMGKVEGYEEALRGCSGAASDMASIMSDNLKGDMVEAESALEGLGIAAYDYIDGPLRGTVQGVTDVINNITDAITPQKSELESFIDEIAKSNDEVRKSIENADTVMSSAGEDAASLEAYKQTLLSLNTETEKTEFQKYQVKRIVTELSSSIPGLAAAFDEETGSIKLTNEEISNLIDNQKALILQQSAAKAFAESQEALFEANLNVAKSAEAVEEAQRKIQEVEENGSQDGWWDYVESSKAAEKEWYKAVDAQKEAQEVQKEAQEEYELTSKAVETATQETAKMTNTTLEASTATEEAADSEGKLGEAANLAAENVASAADAQKSALDAVRQKYEEFRSQLESDIQNKISLFDSFDGGEDMSVEQMLENLQSQREGLKNWKENMETLAQEVGTTITPEFYNAILEMGPKAANAVQHMVDTLDQENGRELLSEVATEWGASMDLSEGMAEAFANTKAAIDAGLREIGSSDLEFTELEEAVSSAKDGIAEGWSDLPDAIGQQLDGAIQAAKDIGIQIPEGLAEGIASGEISPENAISQLNGSMQGMFDGLVEIARSQGIVIPQELSSGIQSGGQAAVDAYNALIALLMGQAAQAQEVGGEFGTSMASEVQSSIESGTPGVGTAAASMASTGAQQAQSKQSEYQTAGNGAAQQYAQGISSAAGQAQSAASAMATRVLAQLRAKQYEANAIGYNISSGVASGIGSGQALAVSAAAGMATAALAAAKAALGIRSPSRRFRYEVGQNISESTAFGIKDKASLAGKAASKMSAKVYTKATSWMSRYKKAHKVTLEDEKYFWQQIQKHTKEGTSAYKKAQKQIDKIVTQQIGSSELATQIGKNFGVSRTTKSGRKKKKKDSETYYSEIYSAAEKYMKNYQVLHAVSEQQELAYWTQVKSKLKSKTQAWYDATAKIKSLQQEIAENEAKAAEEAVKTKANVQDDLLDKYKVYYKVSAKAEMEYWNIARKQFKAGTDERIEADKKYMDALQEFYDQRKELDEEYKENSQEINDQLIEDIKDLQDAYKDAVQSRKDDILSQMNLFEAWDSEGYDADTLLYNLKTQVAGLTLWEQQLEELGKKGISSALLEELKEMGPDAAASIYSLNQMTAEQLSEYQKLWEQKNALAESQAVKDNEGLRQDTNKEIADLRTEAQAELNALNAEYRSALNELNTGLSSDLRNLVNKAGSIGEEAVSKMIASIGKAANSVETYKSTTKVVNSVSSQLGALTPAGTTIGKSTLDGLLKALTDESKISIAAKKTIQSIKQAMQEEAEIHSPAKLFDREVGGYIPDGVAGGMNRAVGKAETAARNMVLRTFRTASEEMKRQQDALSGLMPSMDLSGITRLNRLMNVETSQRTIVNVDNSSINVVMRDMISEIRTLRDEVGKIQIVLYPDKIAGELQPYASRENAASAIRTRRRR